MQGERPRGHWISDGGRLRWISADEAIAEYNETTGIDSGDVVLPDLIDESPWSSDIPLLPPGAPESFRIRAALAWLMRQIAGLQERINELTLIEYEAQRARDSEEMARPRRRRRPQPPTTTALELAFHRGALEWYEAATAELREQADRSSGRALVEWYLWLMAAPPLAADQEESLGRQQNIGYTEAHEATRGYAERLVQPEVEED
jgi:hypothetical protein